MQKEFKFAKLIKISSVVYCAVTILFFLLLNVAASFVGQAIEGGQEVGALEFNSMQQFCITVVNLLIYVELFGYFAILWMVFMFFVKKNQYSKMHRPWPATEKFPLWFFLAGLVFFLIFMSMMRAMMKGA